MTIVGRDDTSCPIRAEAFPRARTGAYTGPYCLGTPVVAFGHVNVGGFRPTGDDERGDLAGRTYRT
jgi:hypothetical protein